MIGLLLPLHLNLTGSPPVAQVPGNARQTIALTATAEQEVAAPTVRQEIELVATAEQTVRLA